MSAAAAWGLVVAVGMIAVIVGIVSCIISVVRSTEFPEWMEDRCVCGHEWYRHQQEAPDGACDAVGCTCPSYRGEP